jgi:hypothetical protein
MWEQNVVVFTKRNPTVGKNVGIPQIQIWEKNYAVPVSGNRWVLG